MNKKIRVGIELNHVLRNINFQILKYYQEDFDDSLDLEDVNVKCDVIKKYCNELKDKKKLYEFLYETYPYEIYGAANQSDRNLIRDLNSWIADLFNENETDIEFFIYSMKEGNKTISSSYYFLSKTGTRVRKILFPKTISELMSEGDVFITTENDVTSEAKLRGKKVILIKMGYNKASRSIADVTYKTFRDFLEDKDKLKYIKEKKKWSLSTVWIWTKSLISSIMMKTLNK